MSLVIKAESFLEASEYDVSRHQSEQDFLLAAKPDIGGASSITCVGIAEKPPESSAQYQIEERFERVAREFPNATLKFLSGTGTGGYQAQITDHLRRHLKVSILPPALFFDTPFKYDNDNNAASTVRNLANRGDAQEPLRVKQPFRLASGEQGDDLAEYLLKEVQKQSRDNSPSPALWIVSAPAGYGKSIMFASLFRKVYELFQDEKRLQRSFPRPLPMTAEHLRSSAGPNIKGLINAFVQTDFAGHTPPDLFTWMIDNGHGFWMTDGLDEVIAGDADFLDFLLDRLTQPSSSAPLILMSMRDSLLRSKEQLHELIEIGGDVIRRIELLPWEHRQKHSFAWTKVHQRRPLKRDRDDDKVINLVKALTKNEHIELLSSTPFYAAIIVDEFQTNSALSLMSEFELLDLAVETMCDREYRKGGPIQEDVLTKKNFRAWLEELAGEVVKKSGISIDELRDFSKLVLVLTTKGSQLVDQMGELSPEGSQLVDQIMVIPFLKNSPVSGKFEFTHEILGEFLAGSFYAKQMQVQASTEALDWGSRYLGQQALLSDSMLLKVLAWSFQEKRDKLVEAINAWASSTAPSTVHRNVIQVLALMENSRELLDRTGLSLEGADLSEIQFGSMDLHKVCFVGSDMSFTDLSKCNLQYARFESARLRDTLLPAKSSQLLSGATFDGMKSFESILPQGESRIVSYDRFLDWAEDATQVAIRRDLPCPSARQLAHLFGKFVRPNGAARRDWIDERGLLRGKQIEGGPGYRNTVEKVLEFHYLEETSPRSRRGVSRPRGPLYGEIVQFMMNSTLSPGLGNLLASLCRRPNCSHVTPWHQ